MKRTVAVLERQEGRRDARLERFRGHLRPHALVGLARGVKGRHGEFPNNFRQVGVDRVDDREQRLGVLEDFKVLENSTY